MTHWTRRTSLAAAKQNEQGTLGPVTIPAPLTQSLSTAGPPSPSLSSSIGKSKRTPTIALARRRNSTTLRPPGLSHSLGAGKTPPGDRGRSASFGGAGAGGMGEEEDDGEVKGAAALGKKDKFFECETCRKVYRHSTCLVKHRWEHTAHWKEASKLLLSKHQQVQLLEAAAIIQAAASGSSLPDEKSYWPAAVSPPSSGLLGSQSLNINVLTSPRLYASQSLRADPSLGLEPTEPPLDEAGEDDEEEDDEEEESDPAESSAGGDDLLAEGMFEMEIDGEEGRSSSVGEESGYGSMGKEDKGRPLLGFFEGRKPEEGQAV